MIGETGIWSDAEAYAHDFSYGVARFISKYFEKEKNVIDLGCGRGRYLQYLSDVGFEKLLGIDGSALTSVDFDHIILDLSQSMSPLAKGNVISLEVFEHIPEQYETNFIENIVSYCDDKLVLSVAVEGQPGLGHVNCRNNDYVIKRVEEYGFEFVKDKTDQIRGVVENHVNYFRNTLMVFNKIPK